MKCTRCGNEIAADSNFCATCGAPAARAVIDRGPLRFEVKYGPSYALLEVQIPENGRIIAEAGALTYMSSNIEVETRTRMKETGARALWITFVYCV